MIQRLKFDPVLLICAAILATTANAGTDSVEIKSHAVFGWNFGQLIRGGNSVSQTTYNGDWMQDFVAAAILVTLASRDMDSVGPKKGVIRRLGEFFASEIAPATMKTPSRNVGEVRSVKSLTAATYQNEAHS
jgi:hypothetical protein